jgi:hypothetical protein
MAIAAVLGLFLFSKGVLEPFLRLFDTMVLEKGSSASAAERFYWNQKSLMAFLDTYGLGVGLGSSRASSTIFAIVSQLGIIGALLFMCILVQLIMPLRDRCIGRKDPTLLPLCVAVRSAGVATFIGGAIAGAGADPGILLHIILATLLVGRAHLEGKLCHPSRGYGEASRAARLAWAAPAGRAEKLRC